MLSNGGCITGLDRLNGSRGIGVEEIWCDPFAEWRSLTLRVPRPGARPVIPRDGTQSHAHVGSYGAYVGYATIQASRDLAVGAFTNLGGGQHLRDGVAKAALQIATRVLSTEKKLSGWALFVGSCDDPGWDSNRSSGRKLV
jgi:hypothetical protein